MGLGVAVQNINLLYCCTDWWHARARTPFWEAAHWRATLTAGSTRTTVVTGIHQLAFPIITASAIWFRAGATLRIFRNGYDLARSCNAISWTASALIWAVLIGA